ncbi:MAG: cobalamin biosynthesis protein [Dehalococcoidales bacterium]|nr:MAG: cobalamin biosynthesis protein [Dehalococcoidales bacterium]
MLEYLYILPLALVIDWLIGEYPAFLHPVTWVGNVISLLLKAAPRKGSVLQFVYGIFIVIFTAALFTVPVFFLLDFLREWSSVAFIIVGALLLKSTFSISTLYRLSNNVKQLLDEGKISDARKETSYLVSRDTTRLNQEQITSAIVEMETESITDSLVAPLFWWLIFGVPGAIAYRVINTFDSRIGYHGEYEYTGKFTARLDDILNYIPARLAGLLLVLSAYIARKNGRKAWRILLSDHGKTSSPNAGWTMSASAGALDIRLEKPGHYRLGNTGREPGPSSISGGLQLMVLTCLLWCCICIGIMGVRYAITA